MRLSILRSVLLATALVGAPSSAFAATITFDDLGPTNNGIFTTVDSGGFRFNGDHFHIIDNPGDIPAVDNGTKYLTAEKAANLGQPIDFFQIGGGTFTLNSADIAELWLPGNANNDFFEVVFTGTQQGGAVLNAAFTLDGVRDGAGGVADFQTVNFNGWTNLVNVRVTGRNAAGAFGDYTIDNLVVNGGPRVPEPATWALMILGFGAIGSAMRRKRQAIAYA